MNDSKISLPLIADGEDKSSPLANRIRNNYKHVRKWAKRTSTDCFRIYDREIHQYPLAIDFYAGRFSVQYFSPRRELLEPSTVLIEEIENVLHKIFGATSEVIYWRTRAKRKETRQYERAGESKDFFITTEYGIRFKVNLVDYLDTGLFLDHRETRHWIASHAKGKRLLNLFAYTCSFSVHSAAAGATFTKSVDMSNTYTEWGRDNFRLNVLPLNINVVVRADCLKFLEQEIQSGLLYDIIVIDPPTISRSKKMDQLFDIQVDYVPLLEKALRLLDDGGVVYFSTNSRKFCFDPKLFPACKVQDISEKTIPIDFHDKKIHRCWQISKLI